MATATPAHRGMFTVSLSFTSKWMGPMFTLSVLFV